MSSDLTQLDRATVLVNRKATIRVAATILTMVMSTVSSSCAQSRVARDACARGGVLTPEGIGPLKIGLTPDSLKKVCRIVAERRITEYDRTQFMVPVGSDTLMVYEQLGRIDWIEIRSKAFRTADSIGVGSPIGRLLDLGGLDGGVGDGDDQYELNSNRGPMCGFVFWVDSRTAVAISEIGRRNAAMRDAKPKGEVMDTLRARAQTGTITSIDVHGCHR